MRGLPPPDYQDYKLEFGAYYVLASDNKTTNTPRARAFGAIAMHPTGNRDGSYRFMSLGTGEVINRAPGYWTEAVISDAVIGRVETLAKHQGQPLIQESNLIVEYSPDQVIEDDEYDANYLPPDNADSDDDSLDGSIDSISSKELSSNADTGASTDEYHAQPPTDDQSPATESATSSDTQEPTEATRDGSRQYSRSDGRTRKRLAR